MRKYSYGSRLDEIARNILFGMEIIDKRVDSRPKNIKKELDEEEAKQTMIEQDRFFSDEATKKKLERLKFLIADETNQKKIKTHLGRKINTYIF